ncbi:MAG: hypothetical protein LBF78_07470 [Treponema sp.]|jgi:Na+-transporting methylmalonyl-CoA/oxaloacetate decarboxylase gamma subunit|nr:hypothetical protein [Treponema sp.]
MFSPELKSLIIQVITSWQVLVVTGVLIVYIFLVNYVGRLYRRGKPIPMPKPGSKKAARESNAAPEPDADDQLGLEEKPPQS